MQLNKISLQFLFNDYEKVAYSLLIPTHIKTLTKFNHQGYVCITYELKHSISSPKQLKWLANIKHSMKHHIKVNFEFVESTDIDEVEYKKYSLDDLSNHYKSINTKYPIILFAQNKKDMYQRLCIYAKNLYYHKILSLEMIIYAGHKINDKLNKPYSYKELLNMSNRVYSFILKNKNNLKQQLTPIELKKAYKKGGEMRGKQMKKQKQQNTRMILKLINEGSYIKLNGKPNIKAIAEELNLSRPTVTKLIKESIFSILPLFFVSYVYLYSHLLAYEYKYHNVIANFTLLTERRYIGGYRV